MNAQGKGESSSWYGGRTTRSFTHIHTGKSRESVSVFLRLTTNNNKKTEAQTKERIDEGKRGNSGANSYKKTNEK
jgi:hypothetical protein